MTEQPPLPQAGNTDPTSTSQATDLAREKTKAEILKIRREAQKLEKEVAAIVPADIVRRKADAEIEKLARENRYFWIEPIKAISGLSSILLAIVAVGGLWVSLETTRQAAERADRDAQRAEREVVSSLIRDLGAEQHSLRAMSARRLGAYATDAKFASTAIGSLISAIVLEGVGEVQDAILQALEPARQAGHTHLVRARSQLNGEIVQLFSNADPTTHLPGKADEQRIRGKQQALIKITLALAGITQCGTSPCPADFANVKSMRGSLFFSYPDRLKGARFDNAALTEADFYDVDLSGARFTGARVEAASFIKAKLIGAQFDAANMPVVNHRAKKMERTRFAGADLTGATFVDACLGGADFTGSNADPAALARGFAQGILVEPEKLQKMGTLRSHERCRPIQE